MRIINYIIGLILIISWPIGTGFAQTSGFGTSGSCQDDKNVHCSNWPASLEDVKRSVFLWYQGSSGCSGNLINQKVSSDDQIEQYFVSAKHCIKGKDLSQEFTFIFNFQSPDCDNNSVPDFTDINGSNRIGTRYTFESTVTLIDKITYTDYLLLKLDNPIPVQYNVYYAGWSVNDLAALQLPNYGIHHPSLDIKKIAKSFSTVTFTNYTCHMVTTVIDAIFSFLGVTINTEIICTYTEAQFYHVPIWAKGVVEGGSSGSPLFNNNTRVIGNLSFGIGRCSLPVVDQYGRFSSTWYNSSAMRNALNPDGNYIFAGIPGRQITCYDNLLNLSGDFYPAGDYQPDNQITLTAKHDITTTGDFTIHSGSDFVFKAGESITFEPGATLAPGSYDSQIGNINCNVPCKTGEGGTSPETSISNIELPSYKEFKIEDYIQTADSISDNKIIENLEDIEAIPDNMLNEGYTLSNYPNPFNDGTIIAAYLPGEFHNPEIVIYDVVGKVINRFPLKPGHNFIEMKSDDFKYGIYFYSLMSDGTKIETKKMVYVK